MRHARAALTRGAAHATRWALTRRVGVRRKPAYANYNVDWVYCSRAFHARSSCYMVNESAFKAAFTFSLESAWRVKRSFYKMPFLFLVSIASAWRLTDAKLTGNIA